MLLSRDEISAGIIRVPVQDSRNLISGMTAHGITITPGELVVHFGERDGLDVVYVHCLDLEGSAASIDDAQTRRMVFYRGMFGTEESNP
jgi:multisubunit Na+/H+ antiporter MnhE subunit